MQLSKTIKLSMALLALIGFNESSSARYIQSDPIGLEGGANTYGYVAADPLNKTDPQGLMAAVPELPAAANVVTNAAGAAWLAMHPLIPPIVTPSRDIWTPDKNPSNWSCRARADCNDNIPGNCPEDPKQRFAFGTGIASSLGTARNIAKANATANLQCQPKHVSCKCTGPKGEPYSGGC